jgi:CRP-like cAMP-binding protein
MIDLEKLREFHTFGKEASLKDAQLFIQAARTKILKKRSILFEQGSKSSEILYLRKGLIRMYHIKENGDEITFNLIPEQNLVANFEFIGMGEPSTFYYETLEKCHFFSIDHAVLESIFNRNPRLEKNRKMFLREVVKKS